MASPEIKGHLQKSSSDIVLNTISNEASPESKCPICLDHFKNISYLDTCLHKFCFWCIREWSKNKAECPLCKQPFNSIYHTIRSENDYKRFDIQPTENGSFGNVAGHRFRYRTTLTGNRRPALRQTSPPPDHGIIFEGLNRSLPEQHNRDFHHMMRRLAARQQAERQGRSVRSLREQEVVKFRRALYRRGLRVQSVQDGGRTRDTSAEFFKRNPACLHRLVPWLKRELTVLYGTHGSLVNIVQHIVMTLITRHNMDDQAVLHELRPFLLSHTEHFLHEFLSFARSPFNMEAYDQHAVYDLPGPSTESSGSETSVIAISEDESDSLVAGTGDYATPRITLSQTTWDDETPGPSYSTGPSQVLPFLVSDSDSDSSVGETAIVSVDAVPHQDHQVNSCSTVMEEERASGGEQDCVIIGYVKPIAERTPELVQLSSDSEQSEQNIQPQTPQLPQHIRFTSVLGSPHSVTQKPSKRYSHSPDNTPHTSSKRQKEKHSKERHEKKLSGSREQSSQSNRTDFCFHNRKHPLPKEVKHKRQEKETSHSTSSYWRSYSHYSHRDSGRGYYTETRSSYTRYYRSLHNRSRSRSHGRRQNRDHRERRHSRSNSRVSSRSSNHPDRSQSGSNSGINSRSSNRQSRSRSRSNSKIKSSSYCKSRHDECGRKRKYKTKHLEEHSRESSTKLCAETAGDCAKKKKNKKHHKKSKRKSKSPSLEIVYDDKSEESRKHHKKRKKHKKKSKKHKSKGMEKHSPLLITINIESDSDNTDPTLPSSNFHAASSSGMIADSDIDTQTLQDTEQQTTAASKNSSLDAGNHP